MSKLNTGCKWWRNFWKLYMFLVIEVSHKIELYNSPDFSYKYNAFMNSITWDKLYFQHIQFYLPVIKCTTKLSVTSFANHYQIVYHRLTVACFWNWNIYHPLIRLASAFCWQTRVNFFLQPLSQCLLLISMVVLYLPSEQYKDWRNAMWSAEFGAEELRERVDFNLTKHLSFQRRCSNETLQRYAKNFVRYQIYL